MKYAFSQVVDDRSVSGGTRQRRLVHTVCCKGPWLKFLVFKNSPKLSIKAIHLFCNLPVLQVLVFKFSLNCRLRNEKNNCSRIAR